MKYKDLHCKYCQSKNFISLNTYKHLGFWKSMDTLKDKLDFEEIWKKNPPWSK